MLRERRLAAGLSMGQLAKLVHYSKGYLSKIENGLKPPNTAFARLCDTVLEAGGALIGAANAPAPTRRQVLVAGTMLGVGALTGTAAVPELLVRGRDRFEHLQGLGLAMSPNAVLEPLKDLQCKVGAIARADGSKALLRLAARIAEYTGWMSQEAGDEQNALWWTRHAAELSRAAGDPEIACYAYVREAGLALYRQEAADTINLAQQAQWIGRAGARTLALAARREAQGHALAGDRYATERAFERAAELMRDAPRDDGAYPMLGSTVPDPLELARGWSLCDLGLNAEAAELLDRQIARIPAHSKRSRARFGARRSLAHALAGEVDESCRTLTAALADAEQVDSATIRTDLSRLARTLGRWHDHDAVHEVYPHLKRVLVHR
ncbi:transcriptional regulator [Lentzea guizhouensis]|uniref:Transcriptional regulator n=2 Tax=Lentzea guizhouensis TaxID=1586287 RepID=A0A1B2HN34_9PSEU|nr:transcriptional regulator [Lentzea guizhouensis]